MKEDSTVSCYDRHAKDYDLYQSAVVPGYQEMLDLVAEACRRYLPEEAKIIDLGCGTGNAALAVLRKIPSARIYLIDGSEKDGEGGRGEDLLRPPGCDPGLQGGGPCGKRLGRGIEEGLEGEGYDAIVSTLVLEHLPFDRYKAAIAKCCRLLKPGGWLLAAEGYSEEGSDMQEWFFEEMEERRRAIDPELSDFVARLRDEKETHYYCSKAEKEDWWMQAGFVQVNVLWQYLCIALMAGRKPL